MVDKKSKDPLKDLDHARQIINSLQKRADKYYTESLKAKAMVYDLTLRGDTEPLEKDLKAQVVFLEGDLKKAIKERDKFKKKYNEAISKGGEDGS